MVKESHIIVNKTARLYTSGELGEQTKRVIIVLHGFGQSAKDFITTFEPLQDGKTFIIAPEGLSRFYLNGFNGNVGATWMTKEDRLNEIKDYIHYLDDVYEHFELDRFSGAITALGFSQGSSTLTRWVNATQHRIDNVIVYAGEVAPDVLPLSPQSSLRKTKNYFIGGLKDKYFPPELVKEMMAAYGEMKFTKLEHDEGHEIRTEILEKLI